MSVSSTLSAAIGESRLWSDLDPELFHTLNLNTTLVCPTRTGTTSEVAAHTLFGSGGSRKLLVKSRSVFGDSEVLNAKIKLGRASKEYIDMIIPNANIRTK